jgi:hypothetical protein
MSRIDISLGKIRPSDIPREESWWTQQDFVRNLNLKPPIDLNKLRVSLSESGDGHIFTKNGNHRLAALAAQFGIDIMVFGDIEPRVHTDREWDIQLDRVLREHGIKNYQDWLNKIGDENW